MAPAFLRLIAIASLALIGASWGSQPVAALSVVPHGNLARHNAILAKREMPSSPNPPTTNRRKCRARTTSLTATATSSPATEVIPPRPTTTKALTTTTAKPVLPSPTPINNGGGGKAGIANVGSVDWDTIFRKGGNRKKASGIVYNWSAFTPGSPTLSQIPHGQFAPMMWGQKSIPDMKNVKQGVGQYLLGFNEPEQTGQSNMDVATGVKLWKQYILPLKSQGFTLISPAPSNAEAGLEWLQGFMNDCKDCGVDIVALHFYGVNPADFISHIQTYHNTFGLPLWITEFACQNFGGGAQCNQDQVIAFMTQTVQFMDNQAWVLAYFWFAFLPDGLGNVNKLNALLEDNDRLTLLGSLYLNGS